MVCGRPKKEMPFKAERRHQYWSIDIRYLDMHHLGDGMIYCISILENYSRAILASALSRRQNFEAVVAVLYAAVRKHGYPEALVSDSGGVFLDHRARQVYQRLGIRKEQIQKRQSWQNYIESGFNVQRRMADWYFEKATTWDELVAAHEKWVLDYNYQKHFAHEQREDGRHSPAEVLGWVKGTEVEPERLRWAFSVVAATRHLNRAGYVRFRDFLLYGEEGLAGKQANISLLHDILTLEYAEEPLSRYSVEFQPDQKRFLRVGNPQLYEHPYRSPQLPLWEPGEVKWEVIIACPPYTPRRKRERRAVIIQISLGLEDPPQDDARTV